MEAKQVRSLMEAYTSIYTDISESHFKVGDEVVCKASGMEGEIVKVDPEGKGKYYTVKREDGKTMKYAPDELKLDKEEEKGEKEEEGASKEKEGEFHDKLDKMVHKTFGKRPEEKKMKEEVETDLFDYLLEYLVAEGYADTNKAALAIMANMSEEWKQSIVEQTARIDYTQDKFNRQNAEKSGSGLTYIPGKQNAGQALQKAKESARQMGKLEGV
jgi:hypothetical protein